jgi:hypothetical protein
MRSGAPSPSLVTLTGLGGALAMEAPVPVGKSSRCELCGSATACSNVLTQQQQQQPQQQNTKGTSVRGSPWSVFFSVSSLRGYTKRHSSHLYACPAPEPPQSCERIVPVGELVECVVAASDERGAALVRPQRHRHRHAEQLTQQRPRLRSRRIKRRQAQPSAPPQHP